MREHPGGTPGCEAAAQRGRSTSQAVGRGHGGQAELSSCQHTHHHLHCLSTLQHRYCADHLTNHNDDGDGDGDNNNNNDDNNNNKKKKKKKKKKKN